MLHSTLSILFGLKYTKNLPYLHLPSILPLADSKKENKSSKSTGNEWKGKEERKINQLIFFYISSDLRRQKEETTKFFLFHPHHLTYWTYVLMLTFLLISPFLYVFFLLLKSKTHKHTFTAYTIDNDDDNVSWWRQKKESRMERRHGEGTKDDEKSALKWH